MKSLNIYLADDDLEDREFFMYALADLPMKIVVNHFDNGIDLMDKLFLDKTFPDVIFLDLFMPIMDGFECLADIRSFEKFNNVQIVVYSSMYREREVKQLKNDGANQYLKKSSSLKELKDLLFKSLTKVNAEKNQINKQNDFLILD